MHLRKNAWYYNVTVQCPVQWLEMVHVALQQWIYRKVRLERTPKSRWQHCYCIKWIYHSNTQGAIWILALFLAGPSGIRTGLPSTLELVFITRVFRVHFVVYILPVNTNADTKFEITQCRGTLVYRVTDWRNLQQDEKWSRRFKTKHCWLASKWVQYVSKMLVIGEGRCHHTPVLWWYCSHVEGLEMVLLQLL
jgi:hypothetical protein